MNRKRWENLLAAHADALAAGREADRRRARLLAQGEANVLGLMDVAEAAHQALVDTVVAPDPAFRDRLRQEVIATVRHRSLWQRLAPTVARPYLVWGAVASAVSVAGGVGFFLYWRSQLSARTS